MYAFDLILDYKVPFVPSHKEYEVVFISEGERVVIPCRGSMENLNVTLHTVRKSFFCFPFLTQWYPKCYTTRGYF